MVMRGAPRVVVSGLLAQYPLGGVTWDYLQYVLGLHRMGVDVYYVEDTGLWPYDPTSGGVAKGCDFNVDYLAGVMKRYGLRDRWAYRFPWEGRWYGLEDTRRREILASADLVLNVSGVLRNPAEYGGRARLAYLDSDPVFTQIKLARGQQDFRRTVDLHDVHFSFGESLPGNAPDTGHDWLPTRQPIVLDEWNHVLPARDAFTTVMNWTSYNPVEHEGQVYGQKDVEFRRFIDLPGVVAPTVLEVAVAEGKTARAPRDLLAHKGWKVVDPAEVCPDAESYRRYLQTSRGEWSVAKHGYVSGRAGWFSCRSACYLAAGRPVVVQDTGLEGLYPLGEGLLAFRDLEGAATALASVEEDYARHCDAARDLAATFFDAAHVLASLLERSLRGGEE